MRDRGRYGGAGTRGCRAGRDRCGTFSAAVPGGTFLCMWDLLAGPFLAAGGLLVVAGLPKLRDPLPLVRALRTTGLPASGLLVAVAGAGRGGRSASRRWSPPAGSRRPSSPRPTRVSPRSSRWPCAAAGSLASCGCFGRPDTPPTRAHLVLTAARDRDGGRARRLPAGNGGVERRRAGRRPPPSRVRGLARPPSPTWSSPCCRPRPPPSAACRRGDSDARRRRRRRRGRRAARRARRWACCAATR